MTDAEQALFDAALKFDRHDKTSFFAIELAAKAVAAERVSPELLELGHRLFVESTIARLRWLRINSKLCEAGIQIENNGDNPLFSAWYDEAEAIVKAEDASR